MNFTYFLYFLFLCFTYFLSLQRGSHPAYIVSHCCYRPILTCLWLRKIYQNSLCSAQRALHECYKLPLPAGKFKVRVIQPSKHNTKSHELGPESPKLIPELSARDAYRAQSTSQFVNSFWKILKKLKWHILKR